MEADHASKTPAASSPPQALPARASRSSARFHGILFDRPLASPCPREAVEPACFPDLNLDQVFGAMTAGLEEYELEAFAYAPLQDVAAVRYRHDVLRDLEQGELLESIRSFAEAMRRMRRHLALAEKLGHRLQKQIWFLDAVEIYSDAVQVLAARLRELDVASRGFSGLREYLDRYAGSEAFTSLAAETRERKQALAAVRYTVRLRGNRVTVGVDEGEADYSAEVVQTFAKFKRWTGKSYLVKLPDSVDLDHVEARILDLVARLHPNAFGALRAYWERHADFLDETIATFDRQVQFYVAYLDYIRSLASAGLPFCYPHVSGRAKESAAEEAFDLALAAKLVPEGGEVVRNGFHLEEPERVLVVTGPNNGGKTTFARMFGQLHYLAALGLPVPGRRARLFLPDRVFTHFEREEDLGTLRGKLEDELVRVHEILAQATDRSVIVMNESFGSTTLGDAIVLGTEVLRRILELGSLAVYVTFVDELASLSESTVSMVATVVPDDPARRTYELVRKPADGLAYAWAIAEKYGLTYERLRERIAS